jgi:hypothetical protein
LRQILFKCELSVNDFLEQDLVYFQTWFTDDKDLVDTMFTKEAIALKEAIAISNRISLATRMNVFQGRGGEPYQVDLIQTGFKITAKKVTHI